MEFIKEAQLSIDKPTSGKRVYHECITKAISLLALARCARGTETNT